MFIITPSTHFEKKARKWILVKDFLIADASDAPDSEITEMGNRIDCGELVPTPKLCKIALDPTGQEARIMRNNLNRYLDSWLGDDSVLMRINYLADVLSRNFMQTGEDINVFIVMRKEFYRNYGEHIANTIKEQLGDLDVVRFLTKKMEKDAQKRILSETFPRETYEAMAKAVRKNQKMFDKERLRTMYKNGGALS